MRAGIGVPPPLPPVKPLTVSTAGSAATMSTICSRILSMAWNEVSWSAMNLAHHAAVVLLREESLGHVDEQIDVQRDGASRISSVTNAMAQHHGERPAVGIDDPS